MNFIFKYIYIVWFINYNIYFLLFYLIKTSNIIFLIFKIHIKLGFTSICPGCARLAQPLEIDSGSFLKIAIGTVDIKVGCANGNGSGGYTVLKEPGHEKKCCETSGEP